MATAAKKEINKMAEKCDTKLAINGSFEDVMKVFVDPMPELKEEPKNNNLLSIMKSLIILILATFSFFHCNSQSIDMPISKIKTLLCKKWIPEYDTYGNQKIYKDPKSHFPKTYYEFKNDNTLLVYDEGQDIQKGIHGTWEYIPEKKQLRFGAKGKYDTVFSLEENKLITQIKVVEGTPLILHVFKVSNN